MKTTPLLSYALPAALIGLIIIAIFVFPVTEPKPEWGTFWQIKPLLLTPLITAFGGVVYYFVKEWFLKKGWSSLLAIVLGAALFFLSLWLGIILGLNGTLWD